MSCVFSGETHADGPSRAAPSRFGALIWAKTFNHGQTTLAQTRPETSQIRRRARAGLFRGSPAGNRSLGSEYGKTPDMHWQVNHLIYPAQLCAIPDIQL